MMLIGIGLSELKLNHLDLKFLTLSLLAKFVIWTLLITGLIIIDKTFLALFSEEIHQMMFLLSIVPLAANAVAFSSELKINPEKASLAVFTSTVIALFYIPLFK